MRATLWPLQIMQRLTFEPCAARMRVHLKTSWWEYVAMISLKRDDDRDFPTES